MFELKNLIHLSAWLAVGLSLIAAYLKLNKIWKRKHQAEVAQSVSLMGHFVDILPLFLLSANYFVVAQWQGFLDGVIWIIVGIVMMLIGTGHWVQGERRKSLLKLARQSLALEREEVGDLARSIFYPSHANLVVRILTMLAIVDEDLQESEKAFIKEFADRWHIELDWNKVQQLAPAGSTQRILEVRHLTEKYLVTSPPNNQVSQLGDIFDALVQADQHVSPEERVAVAELKGLIENYIATDNCLETYTVTVVPQTAEQFATIVGDMSHLTKAPVAGGVGYIVSTYFSKDYAELICQKYRDLGFFTVTVEKNNFSPA
jgi:hypothetical protein